MLDQDAGNDHNEPTGDCFVTAFNTLVDKMCDPDSREVVLVHGNVARLPQVGDVNHAWVEDADTVFDNSNGFCTEKPKDTYYANLQITAPRRYTTMEATRLNGQYEHYGPWPDVGSELQSH